MKKTTWFFICLLIQTAAIAQQRERLLQPLAPYAKSIDVLEYIKQRSLNQQPPASSQEQYTALPNTIPVTWHVEENFFIYNGINFTISAKSDSLIQQVTFFVYKYDDLNQPLFEINSVVQSDTDNTYKSGLYLYWPLSYATDSLYLIKVSANFRNSKTYSDWFLAKKRASGSNSKFEWVQFSQQTNPDDRWSATLKWRVKTNNGIYAFMVRKKHAPTPSEEFNSRELGRIDILNKNVTDDTTTTYTLEAPLYGLDNRKIQYYIEAIHENGGSESPYWDYSCQACPSPMQNYFNFSWSFSYYSGGMPFAYISYKSDYTIHRISMYRQNGTDSTLVIQKTNNFYNGGDGIGFTDKSAYGTDESKYFIIVETSAGTYKSPIETVRPAIPRKTLIANFEYATAVNQGLVVDFQVGYKTNDSFQGIIAYRIDSKNGNELYSNYPTNFTTDSVGLRVHNFNFRDDVAYWSNYSQYSNDSVFHYKIVVTTSLQTDTHYVSVCNKNCIQNLVSFKYFNASESGNKAWIFWSTFASTPIDSLFLYYGNTIDQFNNKLSLPPDTSFVILDSLDFNKKYYFMLSGYLNGIAYQSNIATLGKDTLTTIPNILFKKFLLNRAQEQISLRWHISTNVPLDSLVISKKNKSTGKVFSYSLSVLDTSYFDNDVIGTQLYTYQVYVYRKNVLYKSTLLTSNPTEIAKEEILTAYPNPMLDQVQLSQAQIGLGELVNPSFMLTNSSGFSLLQFQSNLSDASLRLSSYLHSAPAGLYLLRVSEGDRQQTLRLVKQ